jgi:FixJ family two-component response regulator
MKPSSSQVILVEDKRGMTGTLRRVLESAGYRVRAFSSLEDTQKLLDQGDAPSCAIVDLDLPGGSGLAVQSFLTQTHPAMPVIFISSHADVPSSVKVMKAGALDLLVIPFDEQKLLDTIRSAVAQEHHVQEELHELQSIRERVDALTRRETDVLECLLRGLLNKQTAAELGTSEKTVKVHRGRIMKKMRVQSIAELVQLVMRLRTAAGSRSAATKAPQPNRAMRPRSRRA